jgi:cellulose synthase operon protein B
MECHVIDITHLFAAASTRRARRVSLRLLAALMLFSPAFVSAAAVNDAQRREVVALAELMANPSHVRLRGASVHYDFHVGLSPRVEVIDALLRLRMTSSISLLQERSHLRVALNGATMAQIPLSPSGAQSEFELALPAAMLVPGFNRLTFSAAQHYTEGCEDPSAPELWTEIDTRTSALELSTRPRRFAASLADLDALMGPATGNPRTHVLLTATEPDEALLTAGARIAEAIGLRLQFVPPRIRHARAIRASDEQLVDDPDLHLDLTPWPDADLVLLGTRDQLSPYMSGRLHRQISDAYLAVHRAADDDDRLVFIVSGTNPSEVERAAAALAQLETPQTDSDRALVHALGMRRASGNGSRHFLTLGGRYAFSDLGYRTRTVRGYGDEHLDLRFDLPPDFYVAETENLELALDFAYGANMRADSVLNLLVNGSFQQAIPLNNPRGAVLREYRLQIPLRSFRRGPNTITFEPVIVPMITGECLALEDRNLIFTLFEQSRVRVPHAVHYVAMPDLALFAATGFPFYAPPNTPEQPLSGAVTLYGSDSATTAAAWTFLARLAQAGGGGSAVPVTRASARQPRHQLLVGAWDTIDPALVASAPIAAGAARQHRPLAASPAPQPGFFQRLTQGVTRVDAALPPATPARLQLTAPTLLREHGLVTAFESPLASGYTMTVLSAATPALLLERVDALVQPAVWTQLSGDVALWTEPGRAVHADRAGTSFMLGDPRLSDVLRYRLTLHPWILVAGVLALLALAAALVSALLQRRTRRTFGDDVTVEH